MIKANKDFTQKEYRDLQRAYKGVLKSFKYLYPHLRKEDNGIDVDLYMGIEGFTNKKSPVAKLELDVRHEWKGKDYPKEEVLLSIKKQKFINEPVIPFWVVFNNDFSNCGIIPFYKIARCEIAVVGVGSIEETLYYKIPTKEIYWGIDELERYLIGQSFQALNEFHKKIIR